MIDDNSVVDLYGSKFRVTEVQIGHPASKSMVTSHTETCGFESYLAYLTLTNLFFP